MVVSTPALIYICTPILTIGLPKLTLDGTINPVQVVLELLGEPVNEYGLNPDKIKAPTVLTNTS